MAILVAVFAVVLFAFAAIIVDLGIARNLKLQAVDAVDAAALAGASDLEKCTTSFPRGCTAAVAAVKRIAGENIGAEAGTLDWANCHATPPADWTWRRRQSNSDCIRFGWEAGKFSNADTPTVVFVALPPQTSPVAFGGIIEGFRGVTVSPSSVAGLSLTTVAPCALCVLHDFDVRDGHIAVSGGGTFYGRTADFDNGSTGTVDSPAGNFLRDPPPSGASAVIFVPPAVDTGRSVHDPLDEPPTPNAPNQPRTVAVCGTATPPLLEGTYTNLTVTSDCRLVGGRYEFEGDVHVVAGSPVSGALRMASNGATASLLIHGSLVVDSGASMNVPSTLPLPAIYALGPVTLAGTATVGQTCLPPSTSCTALYVKNGDLSVGGAVTVSGDVYVPDEQIKVVTGLLTVIGNVVVDDLTVTNAGSISANSSGTADLTQPGTPDVALVR